MAFLDRLLPAWRHRDVDVRATAVRQLSEESRDVLVSIARTDSAPRVRRIAVTKLDDPDLLVEIGRTDADDEVRQVAAARAEELFVERATGDRPIAECLNALAHVLRPSHRIAIATRAAHRDVRRAALDAVTDEPALAEIARRGDDPTIGLEAIGRVSDNVLLQRIAARDAPSAVALAALERISDAALLQALADDRQVQKAVRKHARVRLGVLLGDDHPMRVAAQRERQTQLCVAVERLVDLSAPDASSALRVAEQEWQDLSAHGVHDAVLEDRFQRACVAARDVVTRVEQQRDVVERRTDARRHNLQTRQQLCETVEALAGAEITAGLASARAAWHALEPVDGPDARDIALRFSQAAARCIERYERWHVREGFREQLGALVQEAEGLVASEHPRAASRPRAALERRWTTLASSAAGEKWMAEEHVLQRRFVEAGDALLRQEETFRAERQQRAQAARTHIEALCQRIEQFAARETVTPAAAERATAAVDAADADLRALPAAEREPLRQRLAQARQSLAQRVDAVVVSEEWKRWANAEVQQQLIQEAEALLASDDPQRMLREGGRLDQEWKRAAVAPPQQAQALWNRFRDARRELRRRADTYLADNLAKKEALCQAVEALAESTDWNSTATTIRRLQAEWKEVGPVRQHLSASLFARFRTPANRFFERHNENRRARKEQYEERLGRMRVLCEAAEARSASSDWDLTATELKQLQRDATEVWGRRPLPAAREGQELRESEVLRQRFDTACHQFFERYRTRDALELQAKVTTLEGILADLEALPPALTSAEPPETGAVMARLKDGLAEWVGIGPLPPNRTTELNERLQAVCDAIESAWPDGFANGALDTESNLPQREKLCIRLERLVASIAADDDAPDDLADSLQRALAARTIGGAARSAREQSQHEAREAAERLRDKWQRLGPVIGQRARALSERFAKAYAQIGAENAAS